MKMNDDNGDDDYDRNDDDIASKDNEEKGK